MTDTPTHIIKHGYYGEPRETSVDSIEIIGPDSDGEWNAHTFGCSCCSRWIGDWDLSNEDIRAALVAVMKRHIKQAEHYRKLLAAFDIEGRSAKEPDNA
jgi:hypothetical protein